MFTPIFLLTLACGDSTPPPPEIQGDVILVVVDTLRADTLGFSGHERPTSPFLDAFTSESAWFSRAYTNSTWTLPAMASLLTGLQGWEHRVVHDYRDPDLFGRLDPEIATLASQLKAEGYRTAAFINNAFMAPDFGLNSGFEQYDYEGAGLIGHRTASETVAAGLEWLSSSDKPAFLLLHVMEPHADYDAPAPYQGQFTRDLPHTLELPMGDAVVGQLIGNLLVLPEEDREYIRHAYDEEVLTTDAALGDLIAALKLRSGWENLRLVITSDHGEEFWEFGHYEHGHTSRSVVTQVPLLLKAPGVIPGKKESVVSLVEVAEALRTGRGSLMALAQSTETVRGRTAISEDLLYAAPEISIISDDLRMIIKQDTQVAQLFEVNAAGWEGTDLTDDPAQVDRGRPLFAELKRLRGDLERIPASDPVSIPGIEAFEQLRSLGYVE